MSVERTPLALSVVVPCFNEAACLDELHRRCTAACRAEVGDDYELILVNDGSRDASWRSMRRLADGDPRLLCVDLSRNHGHQLALTAGLSLTRGERILILDADLQDPPELLGPMLELMRTEAAEVVYGQRRARDGETLFKRRSAHLFYRMLRRLTDVDIPVDTGDFRLVSRQALDVFLAMSESARFIRGMFAWIGMRQVPILYDRAPRASGETKYTLGTMLRLTLDAVTGFSTVPLRLASWAGLALSAGSILTLVYILSDWARGRTVPGWTSLMMIILIVGAVQMFVLGVIGEYLGRLYVESKRRPLFVIREVVSSQSAANAAPSRLYAVPHP